MSVLTQKRESRENRTAEGTRDLAPQSERGFVAPEANILETKDNFVLTVEMPGVSQDGLEITLEDNVLTIVGRRKDEVPKGAVLFRESQPRDFRRVFELAPSIDGEKVQARIAHGVLRLELPKAEKVKPKKIAVTG
jgi:HSP20 family protein